ncbi:MAG: hypothetical protein ABIJ18_03470 [archaeon]
MKKILLLILLLLTVGCSIQEETNILDRNLVVKDISQSDHFTGSLQECQQSFEKNGETQTGFEVTIPDNIGSTTTPLYLILDLHTCDNQIVNDQEKYTKGSKNLLKLQKLLEEHNGMMSLGVSKKYAEYSEETGDTNIKTIYNQGSEITLHIHEEYLITEALGLKYQGVAKGGEIAQVTAPEVWKEAISGYKKEVENLCGCEIDGFSGAPYMPDKYNLASELGFETTFNYKNPETHQSDERLEVINPWRPLGFDTIDDMVTYNRNGNIIFIPSGVKPVHCNNVENIGVPFSYGSFDFTTTMIRESLEEVTEGRVNTIIFTIHPWDFENEEDFEIWDEWLTEVIDPLQEEGKVQFSTYSEVAQKYEEWENVNIPST